MHVYLFFRQLIQKIFFCIESKVEFSRELERNEERLNELTLLTVNFGAVPISSSHSYLFVLSKIEKQYCDLAVCPAGQPAERGCKELERWGAFHDKRFDKNCDKLYSLLSALIMSFLIIYFNFRFYSTWWYRHIMKHFIL